MFTTGPTELVTDMSVVFKNYIFTVCSKMLPKVTFPWQADQAAQLTANSLAVFSLKKSMCCTILMSALTDIFLFYLNTIPVT